MRFNSLTFITFFVTLLAVFLLASKKWKVPLLVASSYVFYFTLSSQLALLLLVLTAVSYVMALVINRLQGKRRDFTLYASLSLILGALFYFKYFNFFAGNLNKLLYVQVFNSHHVTLEAIGLSFIIFQVTSYLLDVFYDAIPAEKSFTSYALFVAFFPKLLQGPLERAENLLPQIKKLDSPDSPQIRSGLLLIIWGLFLKMVVADRIGELYVTPVYAELAKSNNFEILLAVFFYTLQLYFDFAGYTKVAIGAARCFGIELSENFDSPLLAVSCTDFWRKWHMTLSSWLRDYIFLPLQMRFRNYGVHGAVLATLITFALAGLWHGASWGFIIFGLIHGFWLATEQYSNYIWKKPKRLKPKITSPITRYLKIICTYILVSIAFIFFRAPEVSSAIQILYRLLNFGIELKSGYIDALSTFGNALLGNRTEPYAELKLLNVLVLLFAFGIIGAVRTVGKIRSFDQLSAPIQWLFAELIIIFVVLFGVHSGSGFAYFKF